MKSKINNVHCCLCSTPSLGRDQFAKSWFKKATYASWVLSQHGDGDERLDSQQISTLEPQSLRQCVTMRRLVDSLGELMPEYTAWEKWQLKTRQATCNIQALAGDQPGPGLCLSSCLPGGFVSDLQYRGLNRGHHTELPSALSLSYAPNLCLWAFNTSSVSTRHFCTLVGAFLGFYRAQVPTS